MATLRIKRKVATIERENHEEQPRKRRARDSKVPKIQEDYINQLSEEIEGTVTKILSKGFSRPKRCILGAL